MTKRNTYIVTAIVVAAVVAGVVVYANWENLRTAIGLGGTPFSTGWIELRDGTTVSGTTYPVTQNPEEPGEIAMPASAPFNGKMARWDVGSGSYADRTGPVVMSLGNSFTTGEYNITMKLKYEGSQPVQAEPLKIEALNASGAVTGTQTIQDGTGNCNRDNTDWVDVNSECSSGGGTPLKLTLEKNGKLRFTATDGSLNIGGVKLDAIAAPQVMNVEIPKQSTNLNPPINGKENITFRFTIKNTTAQPATKVFFYDTFMDGNLDGQISMDSTIGTPGGASATFTEILSGGACAGSPDAGGYCFMDLGGTPGKYDTIVGYLPTLEANASVPINITFKPDLVAKPNGFDGKTYTNYTGITSQEMNAGNATYPGAILAEIAHTNPTPWTWKTSSASVEVTGGVSPALQLSITKTPATQNVPQGGTAQFDISRTIANGTANHLLFVDGFGWEDPTIYNHLESITYDLGGGLVGTISMSQPSICDGEPGVWGVCLLDYNQDGSQDSVIAYNLQVAAGTAAFGMDFKFKSDVPAGKELINHAAITSQELNGADYLTILGDPNRIGEWANFNWKRAQAVAKIIAGGIVTPTPADKPHAKIGKTVAKSGLTTPEDKLIKPGDTVEYTITLENDGNQDLTNMKVIDNFDTAHLENISITSGARCEGLQSVEQVCFNVGTIPAGTSMATPLKYTAKVKAGVPNNTEVNNNANCISDQFPKSGGGLVETCHTSAMFKVNQMIQPVQEYKLWVNKDVDKATARGGDNLTYTTTGGNNGQGSASHIWMIDSLLFAENGQVILPQIQQAVGKLSQNSTILEIQTVLEQNLGISQAGTSSTGSATYQPGEVVMQYKNKPGDDATTGLAIPLSAPGQTILDLDRDGIKDTVVHLKDATWTGATGGVQTLHTQKPYTSVRRDLAPGDYKIINTALVVKADTQEVYNDPAETTAKIVGNIEALPAIGVTKTVSDTDEINKTTNTASAGEAMTYTVNYTNTGSGPAKGAFIEDDYDERYIKITDNGGAQDSGTALFWSLGNVAAGQTVTKTFKVTVNADLAEVGANFKNIGIAGAQGQTNKSAETTTTVPVKTTPEDQPYLVQTKSVVNENGGAVEPGDSLRYTVTIENKGRAAATNVAAEDTLPAALENLKIVTIPTGAKDETSGNKIKITGFTVNPGASVQIVYTASVKAGTANGTKISNDIVVTYSTTGTTGGRVASVATGRVGSAFTGPNTGAAEANLIEAGAAKAAETGANSLTTTLVVIGLAIAAGITAVILRKRSLVS